MLTNSNEDVIIERQDDHNDTASAESSQLDKNMVNYLVRKETRHLFYTRALLLLVLISAAMAVSVLVYSSAREAEKEAFKDHFFETANNLAGALQDGAQQRILAIHSFANQVTSYALATNSSWPNVAIPDFERRAGYTLQLAEVASLVIIPIVTSEERRSWEEFSVDNEGWLADGLAVQGIPKEDWDEESLNIVANTWGTTSGLHIPTEIFRINGTGRAPENGEGPYAPAWQFAPAVPTPQILNYNMLSHPSRAGAILSVLNHGRDLVTEAWDYSDETSPNTVGKKAALNLFLAHGGDDFSNYEYGPASDLYVPIFGTYNDDAPVVATLSAYVYWQGLFENVLRAEDIGIIVLLENSCGQEFTYEINASVAKYIGAGDLHDSKYDHMKVATEFGFFTGYEGNYTDVPKGQCIYRLQIFPSTTMENSFLTNEPLQFSMILASSFLFTCGLFLLYDFLVERRQRMVLSSAEKSNAVVNSLFPKEVRDRLYQEGSPKVSGNRRNKADFLVSYDPEEHRDLEEERMAIADLYTGCTVCFMDVVGFTKWSSGREPSQVFKLLETLYKSFDKSAKCLDVFKVETVGDCYVAVTGVPKVQEDHAVLMAQFAAACCIKVGQVTQSLSDQLGGDTAMLNLRVGMHSGDVTAGVLRGDKARFQLFGDTVNTAARMESTGESSKIQVSGSTAELLKAAGKGLWVQPREREVDVKGKGKLCTYWLQINVVDFPGSASSGEDQRIEE